MKPHPLPKSFVPLACAVLLAMPGCASRPGAQHSKPLPCAVTALHGAARFSLTDGTAWQPIKTGREIKTVCLIQTAGDSYLDMVLGVYPRRASASRAAKPSDPAGTNPAFALRLFENSILNVQELAWRQNGFWQPFQQQARFDLRHGKVFVQINPLSANSECVVNLTNAAVRLRSGRYFLHAGGRVDVLKGAAAVSRPGTGQTKFVTAGNSLDVSTGQISPLPKLRRDMNEPSIVD